MTTFLHISDLHFGSVYLPKVGEALSRTVSQLAPDVIVASGDFTQNATVEEFEEAKAFLGTLEKVAPVVRTPGNHDVPQKWTFRNFFDPFDLYRRYIHEPTDYTLDGDGWRIVSLNSTTWWGSLVPGRLTDSQLEFCVSALQDLPSESIRVVVVHHHLAPAPGWNGGGEMQNARAVLDRFTDIGIDLVLAGHKHRAYYGNSLDFHTGNNRNHGVTLVQSGTTTSRRGRGAEREKNSFNHIEVDHRVSNVTQYMYFAESDSFEPSASHVFPRHRTGPLPTETLQSTIR